MECVINGELARITGLYCDKCKKTYPYDEVHIFYDDYYCPECTVLEVMDIHYEKLEDE